jgi:hypothetical protein
VILVFPIWNEAHERVLGVLVAVGEFPTVQSTLSSIIPIMGISFLIFTLIAGIAGTIYGSVAARGLSTRLDRLSGMKSGSWLTTLTKWLGSCSS